MYFPSFVLIVVNKMFVKYSQCSSFYKMIFYKKFRKFLLVVNVCGSYCALFRKDPLQTTLI